MIKQTTITLFHHFGDREDHETMSTMNNSKVSLSFLVEGSYLPTFIKKGD